MLRYWRRDRSVARDIQIIASISTVTPPPNHRPVTVAPRHVVGETGPLRTAETIGGLSRGPKAGPSRAARARPRTRAP